MTSRIQLRTMVRRRLADTSVDPLWDDALLDDAIAAGLRRSSARVSRQAVGTVGGAGNRTVAGAIGNGTGDDGHDIHAGLRWARLGGTAAAGTDLDAVHFGVRSSPGRACRLRVLPSVDRGGAASGGGVRR